MAYIRGTANNLSGPGINHVFLPSFGGTPYDFIAGGMVKREAVMHLLWSLWQLSGYLGWFIAHLPAAACMGQIRASSAVFLSAHARESTHLTLRLDFIRRLGYGIEFKGHVIRHGAEDEDV